MRNIEIKARVKNLSDLVNKINSITNSGKTIIKQSDIFFNQEKGRLKLRKFESGDAELIYYERPDIEGPKLSSFEKCDLKFECVDGLIKVLTTAMGVKGVVKKERHLYIIDQTRIHIDQVEGLGTFIELEVVLREDQTVEDGSVIAKDLMQKLNIQEEDLLNKAYIDLLLT
ncbi:uncharacterized protein LOC108737777 [Agrilus planipennis]|uniref:Uncharacterized protein LOC108737777 n=1 Tax=Agrilus planipennis TaxID=224129 RepID=A0A1W4X232_AGRPL|nr:uncharacterized protein LOC108737777 [Agrilus planipennis]